LYPNEEIAASWDGNWFSPININCAGFIRGPDMPENPHVGPSICWLATTNINCSGIDRGPDMTKKPFIGQSVNCVDNPGEIYRYDGAGYLNAYPDEEIAESWNEYWQWIITILDCTGFKIGPEMALKSSFNSYPDGQTIKCSDDEASLFRYANGFLRLYPNETSAASWDENWSNPVYINCADLPRGPDMPLRIRGNF
jgi:hypothetical protein